VFNVPLSEGTIISMVSRCAGNLPDVLAEIGRHTLADEVDNADETGLRVAGKLYWAHVLCNRAYTLITLSEKRGWKGMEEIGWLPQFHGILEHDCWAPYWNAPGITHAICCAHLLRELIGVKENHPEFTWPQAFIDLLLEMKKVRDRAAALGKQGLSYYYHHKFSSTYDRIIALAYEETPEPTLVPGKKRRGRKPRGKALSLIDRLKRLKGAVCLFTKNFSVPFDNNQAERDLRMIKAKVKVSGCFRTEKGAQEYLDIMSYVRTAKKLGSNAFEAIKNAVIGRPDFIFSLDC
jgi:transposase